MTGDVILPGTGKEAIRRTTVCGGGRAGRRMVEGLMRRFFRSRTKRGLLHQHRWFPSPAGGGPQ